MRSAQCAAATPLCTDTLEVGLLIPAGPLAGAYMLQAKAHLVAVASNEVLGQMFGRLDSSHARGEWNRIGMGSVWPTIPNESKRPERFTAHAQFNIDCEFNGVVTVNARMEPDRFVAEHIVVEGSIEIQDGAELSTVELSAIGDFGNVFVNSNDAGSHFGWFGAATGGAFVSSSGFLELTAATDLKLLGKVVSVGAPDSGGSGFRLLRVPN